MAKTEDKGKGPLFDEGLPAEVPENEPSGVNDDEEVGVKDKDEVGVNDDDEEVAVDIPPNESPSVAEPQKSIPKSATLAIAVPKDYVDPPPVPFWDISELTRWSLWRAAIAELIASLFFLYIGVLTSITSGADLTCGGVGQAGIAAAFGVTFFVLVYSIAGISGGHITPVITFAYFLSRRVSFLRALIYIIAQVLGAIAGVGLVKASQKGYYQRYGGGANFVHNGYSKGAGLVAETVGAFLLVYVFYHATDPKRKARDAHILALAPLAIGLAVFVIHLATIPITGTGINPARSFAAASLWDHHDHAWHDHWIFWVGPLLGAAIAARYYDLVNRGSFRNFDIVGLSRPAA